MLWLLILSLSHYSGGGGGEDGAAAGGDSEGRSFKPRWNNRPERQQGERGDNGERRFNPFRNNRGGGGGFRGGKREFERRSGSDKR